MLLGLQSSVSVRPTGALHGSQRRTCRSCTGGGGKAVKSTRVWASARPPCGCCLPGSSCDQFEPRQYWMFCQEVLSNQTSVYRHLSSGNRSSSGSSILSLTTATVLESTRSNTSLFVLLLQSKCVRVIGSAHMGREERKPQVWRNPRVRTDTEYYATFAGPG